MRSKEVQSSDHSYLDDKCGVEVGAHVVNPFTEYHVTLAHLSARRGGGQAGQT